MNKSELLRRVEKLEVEVAALRQTIEQLPKKEWRATLGMFANDPVFDEIVRRGKEWRKRANRRKA